MVNDKKNAKLSLRHSHYLMSVDQAVRVAQILSESQPITSFYEKDNSGYRMIREDDDLCSIEVMGSVALSKIHLES
jgi:hypothetical protein